MITWIYQRANPPAVELWEDRHPPNEKASRAGGQFKLVHLEANEDNEENLAENHPGRKANCLQCHREFIIEGEETA